MRRQSVWLLAVALLLMGGTAVLLMHLQRHQRLGAPGVKAHAMPNSSLLEVELPQRVLDYTSEWVPVDEVTSNTLPADTSFGERLYHGPDNFPIDLRVVLMGTDRTSLHKPQYCLTGQGWNLDADPPLEDTVRVERPFDYDLPVVRLLSSKSLVGSDGQRHLVRGVYIYWYVADQTLSASVGGYQRQWWMAEHLLRTGELQRWAYVSCFAFCYPGQETATFERMKHFIAAAVPEFQTPPKPSPGPAGPLARGQ